MDINSQTDGTCVNGASDITDGTCVNMASCEENGVAIAQEKKDGVAVTSTKSDKLGGAVATECKKGYSVTKDSWMRPVDKKKKIIKDVIYVLAAGILYAVSFHYFVATCNFASGGLGGVLAMLKHVLNIKETEGFDYTSLVFTLVNVPLVIPAIKIVSKEFAIKTLAATVVITVSLLLLENVIDPNYYFSIVPGETHVTDVGIRLISSILGGASCGLSLAIALKINASTGGADIVGAMLQKKNPHKSVATMILFVNGVIVAISFFVYKENLMPILLSVIYLYMTSTSADIVVQGAQTALKFEVVTEHAEEISAEIIEKLGHGVTITPAEGMFEHKNKSLLICLINPRQTAAFQSIIRKYPETFAYVGSVKEIIGKFNKGENK